MAHNISFFRLMADTKAQEDEGRGDSGVEEKSAIHVTSRDELGSGGSDDVCRVSLRRCPRSIF